MIIVNRSGFITPIAVILLFVCLMIGVSLLSSSSNIYSVLHNDNLTLNAQLAADAGLDDAIQHLSDDPSWVAPTTATELMNEGGVRTTYQVTVSPGPTATERVLRSVGRVYRPSTDTVPREERAYEVVLSIGSSSGPSSSQYSLIVGPGGLVLAGGALISGNVYIGGNLSMSGGSGINVGPGDILQVADSRCPVSGSGADYPRLCNPAEAPQPISISTGASITGTVMANNQSSSSGMSSPGLMAGAVDVHLIPPPPNRAPIKAATTGTGSTSMTGTSAGCSSGNKSWPANTKITGNVRVRISCKLTINGDVWITGNMEMAGNSQLIVAEGLTEKPIIMIDGSSGLEITNSASILANSSGVGARIVTYHSTASCSPECPDVTGEALRNSTNIATITTRVNASITDGNEFIAAWTAYNMVGGSNIRGAISAQKITLRGGSNINLPSYLTDIGSLGSAPSTISSIHSYRRVY